MKHRKTIVLSLALAIIILLIGGGIYRYLKNQTPKTHILPPVSAENIPVGFKMYPNVNEAYTIFYPTFLSLKINQSYPPAPSSSRKASVLAFPENYSPNSTIRDANISMITQDGTCNATENALAGQFEKSGTVKNKQGIPFTVSQMKEGAAGNFYQTIDYATDSKDTCYHFSLFIHTTNPGAVGSSTASIATLTQNNTTIIQRMSVLMRQMVFMSEIK